MKLLTIVLLLAAAAGCGHEGRSGDEDAATGSAATQQAATPPVAPQPATASAMGGKDSLALAAPTPPTPGRPTPDGAPPPPKPPQDKPHATPKPEVVDFRK